MAGVTLERVSKVYPGGVRAVDRIDLLIADREFVVLVGPSGCGKSTTLRMIAGLEELTDGIIRIGQRVVNRIPPRDRNIAMVFQNYALYPHMTVYKNMAFGLKLRRVPRHEIDQRVRHAAAILGIEGLLNRKPKALSGGQRQRVAVGRAIVRDPACFLFDEPLSNLDAKLRVETRAELKRLHHRLQTTTVYVTHDQEEAMTLGDRVVVMNEGRIQQIGSPLAIYNRPNNRFVAGFLGTPPMNFVTGTVRPAEEGLVFEGGGLSLQLGGDPLGRAADQPETGEVVCGIRPEAFSLEPRSGEDNQGDPLDVTVQVVEPLGSTMDLTCETTDGSRLVARVRATPYDAPRSARLYVEGHQIHLFEPGPYGRRLTDGEA
ncbi:MAG: ABC transporter ATP-binding protein [Pirellulales bacterium]